MRLISIWPAMLGLALAIILILVLQLAHVVDPVPHSLSYASGAIVLIGLVGWALEARRVAGPAPEAEPEHEEEEEGPGPSYWPVILALGVVGIAAGLVYKTEYGAFAVAIPMALMAVAFWANDIKEEMASGPAALPFYVPPAGGLEQPPAPAAGRGGGFLMPVPPRALAAQAAGGAAIAIETYPTRQVSRRGLLRITFWAGLATGLAALAAASVDMLFPRGIRRAGGIFSLGSVDQYPPGSKTDKADGKFWLVNLTEEQGGPGFLALWKKCPHLGCTVPWKEDFNFVDPNTGQEAKGWFRCPCHGSTYNNAGVRVFGPAPRSMDRMDLTIADGRITVDTRAATNPTTEVKPGKGGKGVPENAKFAVKAP